MAVHHAAPATHRGERFLHSWDNVKFFLGSADADAPSWATLASFFGFGRAYLSACRLVFVLDPAAARGPTELSIPVAWLRKDKLEIRRPFFNSRHLSGILVPADVHVAVTGADSVFGPVGRPMEFRIELLEHGRDEHMHHALHEILADPDRVARETKILREAADKALRRTDVHFAFVDPTNPSLLYLATEMARPTENH